MKIEVKEMLDTILEKVNGSVTDKLEAFRNDTTKSAEEKEKAVKDALEDFKSTISEQKERLDALQSKSSLPGLEDEKQEFSFFKLTQALHTKNWSNAGFEKEVLDNMKTKSVNASDGSDGAYTIPTQLASKIIEPTVASMPLTVTSALLLTFPVTSMGELFNIAPSSGEVMVKMRGEGMRTS